MNKLKILPIFIVLFILSFILAGNVYAQSSSQYKHWLDAVVVIQTGKSTGTGFFIDREGIIITNAHVTEGFGRVVVKLKNGQTYEGVVKAANQYYDLALVAIDKTVTSVLPLTTTSAGQPGDDVVAVGTPEGLSWSVSKGIISSIRPLGNRKLVQTDAAINRGNSGGPLIQVKSGRVIGVNSLSTNKAQAEGISFAMGAEFITEAFGSDWSQYRLNHPRYSTYSNLLDQSYRQASAGNFDQAISSVNKALALGYKSGRAFKLRGLYHMRQGNRDDAVQDFFNAVNMAPSDPQTYVFLADMLIDEEKYNEAVKSASIAIAIDSGYASPYVSRSKANRKKGDLKAAAQDIQKAVALDPELPEAYYQRGVLKITVNDLTGALEDFNQASALYPRVAKYREAVTVTTKMIQEKGVDLTPPDSEAAPSGGSGISDAAGAVIDRGLDELEQENYDNAIEYLTKGIEMAPDYAPAFVARGSAYQKKGMIRLSIKDYDRAISLNPRNSLAYHGRGKSWLIMGDQRKAIDDFTSSLTIEQNKFTYVYRALAWEESGKLDRASLDMEQAEKLGAKKTYLESARQVIDGYRETEKLSRPMACFIGAAGEL